MERMSSWIFITYRGTVNTPDGALPHSDRTNLQASSVWFHFFLCLASFPRISLKANLLVRQRESCTCTPSQATHFKMEFNEWWVLLKMQSWQNVDRVSKVTPKFQFSTNNEWSSKAISDYVDNYKYWQDNTVSLELPCIWNYGWWQIPYGTYVCQSKFKLASIEKLCNIFVFESFVRFIVSVQREKERKKRKHSILLFEWVWWWRLTITVEINNGVHQRMLLMTKYTESN